MNYVLVIVTSATFCLSASILGLGTVLGMAVIKRSELTLLSAHQCVSGAIREEICADERWSGWANPASAPSSTSGSHWTNQPDTTQRRTRPPRPTAGGTRRPTRTPVARPRVCEAEALGAGAFEPRGTGEFGPYRLEGLLGHGAMGEVWQAYDSSRGRRVALKLLPATSGLPRSAHERVAREARLAGRLCSAHVIPVHDFGWIDGQAFLDMRLVRGGDLAVLLRAHPDGLEVRRAAGILAQIADALDAAHGAELVHCDVKPSNVLLDTGAAGDFCYLADFGIATLATAQVAASSGPGEADPIFGTPTYMAPELYEPAPAGRPSIASDVYALAVLFFELLTGRPPYPGLDVDSLREQHTHQPVPALSGSDPTLAVLDPIIARALDKDPLQRHRSAGSLAQAVLVALGCSPTGRGSGPVAASEPSPAQPPLRRDPHPVLDSLEAIFLSCPAGAPSLGYSSNYGAPAAAL